ncbi:aspartate/glutamate racemase family protein [Henriciella barbarensis]|uniref:Aspartate/glutamate racemase family protein n=1 Tax=Henriciella barbarensis TaxID=86342 RepID=A0A399R0V1_9PROT|nr:aspartate/glutamate racemase family protein [Henriciella barbarensis]RIJ23517.1 aspartate/glutamate racemase family protein [Henriciella barbarensis]
MKRIGILGGMSPESTVIYYRALNAGARERLGELATADCIIASMNFGEIQAMQKAGDWAGAGRHLARAAKELEAAGVDLVLLATNTMHRCAEAIESALGVPFLHIADATAIRLKADGRARPLLLGTAYTMEQDFYKSRLADQHGLGVIVPGAADRARIHAIIFEELVNGITTEDSRNAFLEIVSKYVESGADSVILGCTEIGMLLHAGNSPLPVYDTALIHCEVALDLACGIL